MGRRQLESDVIDPSRPATFVGGESSPLIQDAISFPGLVVGKTQCTPLFHRGFFDVLPNTRSKKDVDGRSFLVEQHNLTTLSALSSL